MSDDESDQEVQVVDSSGSARPKRAACAAAGVATLTAAALENVIELLSDDDDDVEDSDHEMNHKPRELLLVKPAKSKNIPKAASTTATDTRKRTQKNAKSAAAAMRPLQAGLVLEEDVDECVKQQHNDDVDDNDDNVTVPWTLTPYMEQQQANQRNKIPVELYHDDEFESTPASIEGASRQGRVEKCHCNLSVALSYSTREGPNHGRPYHHCRNTVQKCRYFRWAFVAQKMHWYRFGSHIGHVLVQNSGFSANDLLQGRVGDCWFLSYVCIYILFHCGKYQHDVMKFSLFFSSSFRFVSVMALFLINKLWTFCLSEPWR
jgi:GRF zinc finger